MIVAPLILLTTLAISEQDTPPHLTIRRGVIANTTLSSALGPLRAKAIQDDSANLLVRIAGSPDQEGKQQIELMGLRPGTFDLREYLELADGRPATDLSPLPIKVVALFPPGTPASLLRGNQTAGSESASGSSLPILIWSGWAAWAAIGLTFLGFAIARRRKPAPTATPGTQDASDPHRELLTLLDRAQAHDLGAATLARLEMLAVQSMLRNQSQPLTTPSELAAAIQSLRARPAEGAAIAAMEQWLHSGRGGGRQAAELAAQRIRAALDDAAVRPAASREVRP